MRTVHVHFLSYSQTVFCSSLHVSRAEPAGVGLLSEPGPDAMQGECFEVLLICFFFCPCFKNQKYCSFKYCALHRIFCHKLVNIYIFFFQYSDIYFHIYRTIKCFCSLSLSFFVCFFFQREIPENVCWQFPKFPQERALWQFVFLWRTCLQNKSLPNVRDKNNQPDDGRNKYRPSKLIVIVDLEFLMSDSGHWRKKEFWFLFLRFSFQNIFFSFFWKFKILTFYLFTEFWL